MSAGASLRFIDTYTYKYGIIAISLEKTHVLSQSKKNGCKSDLGIIQYMWSFNFLINCPTSWGGRGDMNPMSQQIICLYTYITQKLELVGDFAANETPRAPTCHWIPPTKVSDRRLGRCFFSWESQAQKNPSFRNISIKSIFVNSTGSYLF